VNWSSRSAECPSCGRRLSLNDSGKMVMHGPKDDRCPGSWGGPKLGTERSFDPPPESGRGLVTSPPPPGVSARRWREVVLTCRDMDDRANRGASTGAPLSLALR